MLIVPALHVMAGPDSSTKWIVGVMEFFWTQIWILIPLAAIAVGAFKEWLKFKAKQDRLGSSAEELGKAVDHLRSELRESEKTRVRLVERIQNLETIVTTEMWDVVHGSGQKTMLPTSKPAAKTIDLPDEERTLDVPDAEKDAAEKVSRIADRLRNM